MSTDAGGGTFPTTDWGALADIRNGDTTLKRAALDILIRRYWKPVFLFLRRTGMTEDAAKDATQAFFSDWIQHDAFGKADESKGRFRSFMLTCLKRFVSNEHRAAQAQKRMPQAGLLSLDELMADPDMPFQPADSMTPEILFQKTWAAEAVRRVLQHLERECAQTGKSVHFDIFSQRIINPILNGSPEPSMSDLAQRHGITEKQAANHLLTAKRAYQRLLKEEIRLYASSETEVMDEIRELFLVLGQ